jgi:nucleoid-associated protein YgaU
MHRAPAPAGQHEPDAWVVRPGDHLWRIAEETLARAWGRAPSDREIDPFWRTVIKRNRSALHDPANPDLLFPGDRIEVPAAPPPA